MSADRFGQLPQLPSGVDRGRLPDSRAVPHAPDADRWREREEREESDAEEKAVTDWFDDVQAVADAAMRTLDTGSPQLLDFGVTNERAWEVGLACGGKMKVFAEKLT